MSTMMTPIPAGGFTPGLLPSPNPSPLSTERMILLARRKHIAIAILSAFTAMILVAVLAFHGYAAWVIAHPYVAPLTSNPKLAKNLDYTDVTFPSKSGRTNVHGWYIPSIAGNGDGSDHAALASAKGQAGGTAALTAASSSRTIVFSHGYGANREETWVPMYDLANLLHRLHYNVFMFDYGYASSDDRSPATGGIEESQQLLAAVQYARQQGADQVVVWGFSMGAGTALQAALQTDSTDKIDALLLDSLFLTSSESLYGNVSQYLDIPRYPSIPLIEWMLQFFTGTNFSKIPTKQVLSTAYDIPMYIMHGTDDVKAPLETAEHIAAGQSNPLSREWIVKGGKHEMLFQTRSKEYITRAALFLSQVDANFKAGAGFGV
ncbi:alpha/beta hydrolase [Paenibacillus solisilvae]|uniref:Alpha/beta hydrolase n=1 Tax=Paenibacillus solisilvae TaxID=2486751 RepID=A0ABW0VYJ3_9BACL